MDITIKNFRGVSEAGLQVAPIALVCGPNHSGKSSIAQAVSAALTGNAAVIEGITKAAAGKLLRDGTKRGSCTVADKAGSSTVNWPGASSSSEGNAPRASAIACGLTSVADMKPKEASAHLIAAIEAFPSLADFQAATAGINDAVLGVVWNLIQASGWDAAHKRAVERGSELKGAWQQLTGEAYGHVKAESWAPEILTGIDVTKLDADLAAATSTHEQAKATQAVSAAEIGRLQADVAEGELAAKAIEELKAVASKANEAVASITAELNALPRPEVLEQLAECPHCKGHLVVVSRTEVRAPTASITQDENNARQAAINEAQARLSAARNTAANAQANIAQHMVAVAAAERARAKLDSIPRDGIAADAIAALEAEVNHIRYLISASNVRTAAADRHKQIQENQRIIDVLAPNGLRLTVLAAKLGAFNLRLGALAAAASWPAVTVCDDMSLTFGGRPYLLLSESEKFRARVTLQIALADIDGSDMVVIDAADILDRAGRNGLFSLLRFAGLKALVCMTMNKAEDVPPIEKAGLGTAYWLDGAVLRHPSSA